MDDAHGVFALRNIEHAVFELGVYPDLVLMMFARFRLSGSTLGATTTNIMKLRPVTAFGYLLLVAAAVVSLMFVHSLKPTSVEAAAFLSIWLLLPYLILAIVLAIRAHIATEIANLTVTVLVVAGGLLFLTIVIFVRPDPQGGIAVLFTPVYQSIAMVILVPLSRWISGKRT
ncbi:MAG: hypothetical protein M3Q38_04730 [Chloroflexota bacterium]|nr:hypothetical protein [Chloroflexota bacterium]